MSLSKAEEQNQPPCVIGVVPSVRKEEEVQMAKSSERSGVRLGLPSEAEYLRVEDLSDEALCEELQSSVKEMGNESLVESAETLVDVLRRMDDKIVTLQATLTRQENELREAARQGLENLGLGSTSSAPSA